MVRDTIKELRRKLYPIYGRGEANAIIELIFLYLKGWGRVDLLINEDKEVSPFIKEEIDKILARLERHEPIQYITGTARFCGLDLHVKPGVLIPRPETEQLVDMIADDNEKQDLKILDACTGSGCIAVALARALRFPEITALDISSTALEVARENDRLFKTHLKIVEADIFTWNPGRDSFDIIVSNPPYIDESERSGMEQNVLDYEPGIALFVSDDDPLLFYRRILEIGEDALVPGGRIYFEINPRHADELRQLAISKGYINVEIIPDRFGRKRFCTASRPVADR